MKKILLTILFVVPTLIFSQKSAGKLSRTDDLSKTILEMNKDYESNTFVLWDSKLSDDAIVYVNNSKIDGKTVKQAFKQHHSIFNDIQIVSSYAHTNYFSDGEVWTNNWFTWMGTGNVTGIRFSNRGHFDFKWENGKIVELQCYYDPTGLNMELAAASGN